MIDGVVTDVRVDEVVVASEDGRRIFQYWHIAPVVDVGQKVEAERTVLGYVTAPAKHVHLTEIVDGVVQNPLQPWHLTPYRDDTVPSVDDLYLRAEDGRELSPGAVSGTIDLVARAQDLPALPIPAPWTDLPVGPALVGFELTTPAGREVLPPQTPTDFARTEPGNGAFFRVYAPGTSQNDPAVGKEFFHGTAGVYLYELTPHGLDTATLRPGRYVVTVTAGDTCGNTGTLSEPIDVVAQTAHGARAHPAAWPPRPPQRMDDRRRIDRRRRGSQRSARGGPDRRRGRRRERRPAPRLEVRWRPAPHIRRLQRRLPVGGGRTGGSRARTQRLPACVRARADTDQPEAREASRATHRSGSTKGGSAC